MTTFWWVMIIAGLATFAIRLSFILLIGERDVAPWARRALRLVPPAVLTAIIVPEMLLPRGNLDLSLGNERLLAGGLAALVAWRTRNVVLTIVVGMLALWLLKAILP
ncbi:MAG: AzlD domain-containing protein [Anaerolineales bacterium]|jgi:branched-subunit amino acid transport protein|nr:AzlD domain-containing protein [Anaerolineales bacterium]